MTTAIDMAMIAALVGDPARANILSALTDGRAQTATELAYAARVSPQTTSGHLGKLTEARLLTLKKQGRHHYYRLASQRPSRRRVTVRRQSSTTRCARRGPATITSRDGSVSRLPTHW